MSFLKLVACWLVSFVLFLAVVIVASSDDENPRDAFAERSFFLWSQLYRIDIGPAWIGASTGTRLMPKIRGTGLHLPTEAFFVSNENKKKRSEYERRLRYRERSCPFIAWGLQGHAVSHAGGLFPSAHSFFHSGHVLAMFVCSVTMWTICRKNWNA